MTQRRTRISLTRRQVAGAAGMVAVFLMAGLLSSPAAIVPATPPVVQTRRALDFLGDAAIAWQNQFDCSGCHKQPLTVAALGAARASGYEAPRPGIVEALMVGGLSGSSGQGPDGCFSFNRGGSFTVATTLGGRGLEAYNLYFGADRSSELLAAAACLLGRQNADGRLASDRLELPVAQGDFITTGLGVFSWTRAFEVSGNVAYETARNQAVTWLRGQIGTMETGPTGFTTQDKSMLLAGLGRAGAGPSDPDVVRMRNVLAGEQLADGSWKLQSTTGGGNAYATGQVVFALRSAGYDRTDPAVDLATIWLLDNQLGNGSWSVVHWQGGGPSAVVPSMWGAAALATYPSPLNGLGVGSDTVIQWNQVDGAESYDLLRGLVSQLAQLPDRVDLGAVDCLAAASPATSAQDLEVPVMGEAFFYLMRIGWGVNKDIYGLSSGGLDRLPFVGGCPP